MRRNLIRLTVVLAVGALALWWVVLRGDAPPAPDIDVAAQVAAAAQTTTTEAPATTAAPTTTEGTGGYDYDYDYGDDDAGADDAPGPYSASTTAAATTAPPTPPAVQTAASPDDPSGPWTVDTTIGDYSDFTSTFVGFRVEEELGRGIGHSTAVGRTPQVEGEILLDGSTLLEAEVRADLSALLTDRPARDGKVRQALDTVAYPVAVFTLDGPVDLGDLPDEGIDREATVLGTLTIKGVTNDVRVDLTAQLVGEVLTVVGTFDIALSDYGVEAPSAPIVVSVEDHAVVEIQLFLTR